jgi:hypothetical protein
VENAVIRDVIETKLQPLDEALAQYVERRAKRQPRREPPGLGR